MRKIKLTLPRVAGIGAVMIIGGIASAELVPDSTEVAECRTAHIIGDSAINAIYENKQELIAAGLFSKDNPDTRYTFKKLADNGKPISFTSKQKTDCDKAYDNDKSRRVGNTKLYPSIAIVTAGELISTAAAIKISIECRRIIQPVGLASISRG